MQENWLTLIQAFDSQQNYVLATIVATQGSTYCKTGSTMLIDPNGQCTGLLSGGCLEADISLHAMEIINGNNSVLLRYDLQADADLLWGLGLGCEGALDILLQPLNNHNNHLGLDDMLASLSNGESGFYCQLIADDQTAYARFIANRDCPPERVKEHLATQLADIAVVDDILVTPVSPPLSLLICGAGIDVIPLVAMAEQMSWQISVWDHRPALLNRPELNNCYALKQVRAERVDRDAMQGFDAVVIMTHNLDSDRLFVEHAVNNAIDYIGLLGPRERRDKLLKQLSLTACQLQGQLFAPVGLDIGGRSPQAIALSICAEIQQQRSITHQQAQYQPWLLSL